MEYKLVLQNVRECQVLSCYERFFLGFWVSYLLLSFRVFVFKGLR